MKVIIGIMKKDDTFVSFSVRHFVKKVKSAVKRFFAWGHRKLTQWENTYLKKIDKFG